MDQGTLALVISAILAAIRVYEFVCSWRLGLSVKPALTSDPEIGNDIVVLNASNTPANIYFLDLVWLDRRWFRRLPGFRKVVNCESPIDLNRNITVPPHGQGTISFSEADYFAWGAALKEDIYLRLWLVGRRKPVWFFVTGPRS